MFTPPACYAFHSKTKASAGTQFGGDCFFAKTSLWFPERTLRNHFSLYYSLSGCKWDF